MSDTPEFEPLTDEEFERAMKELTEYEEAYAESQRLADEDTIAKAEVLDRVFHDGRWVQERNEQRQAEAKTDVGRRPVDPASRSQFTKWLKIKCPRIGPSTVYQLLDASALVTNYFRQAEVIPTTERQLRPLKRLTRVLYGSGTRVQPTWEIACRIAEGKGYRQPTSADVREAINEWNREHAVSAPRGRKADPKHKTTPVEELRFKVINDWRDFLQAADHNEVEKVLNQLQADIDRFGHE